MILSAYKFVLSPLLNSPHNFVHLAYVIAKSLLSSQNRDNKRQSGSSPNHKTNKIPITTVTH